MSSPQSFSPFLSEDFMDIVNKDDTAQDSPRGSAQHNWLSKTETPPPSRSYDLLLYRCDGGAGCPFRVVPQPLHLANPSTPSVVRVILSDVKELVAGSDVTPGQL
ncbi:hypothetical protein Pmani_019936 [Petrolisthes manimaculis]|uniref:Uncharacterized protein n=1 Tax=Petrolisthes manimaculis TaxID=1843537 RepID=A0AAE1U738_9EUCA|nr:hypothetical protein Pmani_019936 [Petrolisthes manimaculis]